MLNLRWIEAMKDGVGVSGKAKYSFWGNKRTLAERLKVAVLFFPFVEARLRWLGILRTFACFCVPSSL